MGAAASSAAPGTVSPSGGVIIHADERQAARQDSRREQLEQLEQHGRSKIKTDLRRGSTPVEAPRTVAPALTTQGKQRSATDVFKDRTLAGRKTPHGLRPSLGDFEQYGSSPLIRRNPSAIERKEINKEAKYNMQRRSSLDVSSMRNSLGLSRPPGRGAPGLLERKSSFTSHQSGSIKMQPRAAHDESNERAFMKERLELLDRTLAQTKHDQRTLFGLHEKAMTTLGDSSLTPERKRALNLSVEFLTSQMNEQSKILHLLLRQKGHIEEALLQFIRHHHLDTTESERVLFHKQR